MSEVEGGAAGQAGSVEVAGEAVEGRGGAGLAGEGEVVLELSVLAGGVAEGVSPHVEVDVAVKALAEGAAAEAGRRTLGTNSNVALKVSV